MVEVSGFTADLYCDHEDHGENCAGGLFGPDAEYLDPSKRGPAITRAKRDGWLFKKDGRVFCPACSKKGNRK